VTGDIGPTMSMGEAVRMTGVSRSTMQRRLAAGDIPGAYRNDAGGWVVPVSGLIAVGLEPRTTPAETAGPDPDAVAALQAEIDRLNAVVEQMPRLRSEIETLRAVNHAQSEHLTDLRKALETTLETIRALPAGPPPTATVEAQTVAPVVEQRRRWWRRGDG